MKQRDPSEPSRLLEDLESIRTLLDEQNDPHQPSADDQLDIPLLQDIIPEPLSPAASGAHTAPPYSLPPRPEDKAHNPFLPYASLAKLAEERMQLDQLLAGQIAPPPTLSPTAGAREVRMEARLQAEAQLILQGVIDDLIPTIEDELRKRMQNKLQQIVREQLK
ncbi:MAG: hypothetical protein V7756_10140 [Halopseudomonas sp.]|uniref:hypothetical protein n=1 Tax=Halopseudomonas sp. TaxID=2901191 RepID=UPI0030039D2A